MGARFPRRELIRRIELIATRKKSIVVKNLDAEEFLTGYVSNLPKKTLVYCDPPYFQKSDRLYLNHYEEADHAHLAKTIQRTIKASWIVSYDAVPLIVRHYSPHRSFVYDLQYNAATAYKGSEVFILSDDVRLPGRSAVKCIDAALQTAPLKNNRKPFLGKAGKRNA